MAKVIKNEDPLASKAGNDSATATESAENALKLAERVEAEKVEAERVEAEKVEAERVASITDDDLVVCVVKKRYSIALTGGGSVTYTPGHVTMPREHAEHWYSKANDTDIIGVPDNGDLRGAGAKARFAKIISDLENLSSGLVAFKADHAGLDAEQVEMLDKASKFLAGAKKLLGDV